MRREEQQTFRWHFVKIQFHQVIDQIYEGLADAVLRDAAHNAEAYYNRKKGIDGTIANAQPNGMYANTSRGGSKQGTPHNPTKNGQ